MDAVVKVFEISYLGPGTPYEIKPTKKALGLPYIGRGAGWVAGGEKGGGGTEK